jgi:leader peptidase (prepilin peptidase) / N-methyltransferase
VYLKVRKIEGLGLGDVKLLLFVGAVFGAECALYTIFLGSVIGSVFGITMVLVSRRNMDQHLPFGPYLAMGTFLFLFGRHLAAQLGFVT